jgi:hypothetical protein
MRPPTTLFYIRSALFGPAAPPVPCFPSDLVFNPSRESRPSPAPGCARGLRTRENRRRARSVGESIHEPYHFLDTNPPSPLVALSPPEPPLANPPAGCLNSTVPPPSSRYSAARRALCLYSTAGQLPRVAPHRHVR